MSTCELCDMHERKWQHEHQLHLRSSDFVHALYSFAYGLVNRYPVCCVLRYSFTELVDRQQRQAEIRGGIDDWPCGPFVVCGIIHQGTWQGVRRPALFRQGVQ